MTALFLQMKKKEKKEKIIHKENREEKIHKCIKEKVLSIPMRGLYLSLLPDVWVIFFFEVLYI